MRGSRCGTRRRGSLRHSGTPPAPSCGKSRHYSLPKYLPARFRRAVTACVPCRHGMRTGVDVRDHADTDTAATSAGPGRISGITRGCARAKRTARRGASDYVSSKTSLAPPATSIMSWQPRVLRWQQRVLRRSKKTRTKTRTRTLMGRSLSTCAAGLGSLSSVHGGKPSATPVWAFV